MIIKCPQCSAAYRIADAKIGDKPKKIRCAKCDKPFVLVRRTSIPPPESTRASEYKELTGEFDHLPQEFAFLRNAPSDHEELRHEGSDLSEEFIFLDDDVQDEKEERKEPEAEKEKQDLQSPPSEIDEEDPTTKISVQSAQATAKPAVPQAESGTSAVPDNAPVQDSAPVPAQPVAAGIPPSNEMSSAMPRISEFDLAAQNPTNKLIGKVMTALVALVVVFLLFVAYRNGWNISMPKLGDQIGFAFSTEARENLPDEVQNLEVMVDTRQTLIGDDKRVFLVVTGGVLNNASASRTNIMLRGRLFDAKGDMRVETQAPCGYQISDDEIKSTAKGAIQGHYRKGNKLHDCTIASDSSGAYQIVFENPPADYDASSKVEVKAVSARYP